MFDIDEIRKQALASMRETMEKNEERISKIEVPSSEKGASVSAAEVEEQIAANTQRQVEILGQMFGPDSMAQMAVNEELLQKMVNDKVAEATSATAGDLMGQLFGEDMGILAAALETLEMEDADDEEELSFWNWKKSSILPWKKQWPGLRPCLSQKRSHIKKTM